MRWEEDHFSDMLGSSVGKGDAIVYAQGLGHAHGDACGLGMGRVEQIEREEKFLTYPEYRITIRAVIWHDYVPTLAKYPIVLRHPERIALVSGFSPEVEALFNARS